MLEIGSPTILELGSGIIAILVVVGTGAAAGMYALGRRSGQSTAHQQVCSQLLPLLSLKNIYYLDATVVSKNLRRALDIELIKRSKT